MLFPPEWTRRSGSRIEVAGGFTLLGSADTPNLEEICLDPATTQQFHPAPKGYPVRPRRDLTMHPESFRITIAADGATVQSSDNNGFRYGLQTLTELRRVYADRLPVGCCQDRPVLPVRGLMIDVSRCKVPRLSTLRTIIEQLACLRYNQLQLYTEHTFAFPGHSRVWKDASPLTAVDYRKLDQLCRSFGIELVPNFNCFGHLERWLRHEHYQHLAEHPAPFTNLYGTFYPNGTTLRPDETSASFIDQLLQDFLPCFTSDQFHIGCDETWELGRGWSASLAEQKGVGRVYLEHLQRLHGLALKHGKTPQFWADIIFQHPELIPELPSTGLPVVWGYEKDHPFASQAEALRTAGFRFLVAPGTSSWLSLTGRWTNARRNIENALRSAIDQGGSGMLLTDWGDRGHHQFWIFSSPPIIGAGAMAWHGSMPDEESIKSAMTRIHGWPESSPLPAILLELSLLDQHFSRARHNWSPLYELLIADQNELKQLRKSIAEEELMSAIGKLKALQAELANDQRAGSLTGREIQLTMRFIEVGLRRGLGMSANLKLEPLLDEFRILWLKRNRPGGLKESLERLRRIPLR